MRICIDILVAVATRKAFLSVRFEDIFCFSPFHFKFCTHKYVLRGPVRSSLRPEPLLQLKNWQLMCQDSKNNFIFHQIHTLIASRTMQLWNAAFKQIAWLPQNELVEVTWKEFCCISSCDLTRIKKKKTKYVHRLSKGKGHSSFEFVCITGADWLQPLVCTVSFVFLFIFIHLFIFWSRLLLKWGLFKFLKPLRNPPLDTNQSQGPLIYYTAVVQIWSVVVSKMHKRCFMK